MKIYLKILISLFEYILFFICRYIWVQNLILTKHPGRKVLIYMNILCYSKQQNYLTTLTIFHFLKVFHYGAYNVFSTRDFETETERPRQRDQTEIHVRRKRETERQRKKEEPEKWKQKEEAKQRGIDIERKRSQKNEKR